MKRFKHQTSFQKDKKKIIYCRNCGIIIGESHLGEKNTRTVSCRGCKNIQMIAPPRLGTKNEKRGAFWCDLDDSCFTAFAE